jgi:hypothetical protein
MTTTGLGARRTSTAAVLPSVRYCCTLTPESCEDDSSHVYQDTVESALEWLLEHAAGDRDTLAVRITLPGRRRCFIERGAALRARITDVVEPVLSDGGSVTVEVTISSLIRPHLITVACDRGV